MPISAIVWMSRKIQTKLQDRFHLGYVCTHILGRSDKPNSTYTLQSQRKYSFHFLLLSTSQLLDLLKLKKLSNFYQIIEFLQRAIFILLVTKWIAPWKISFAKFAS